MAGQLYELADRNVVPLPHKKKTLNIEGDHKFCGTKKENGIFRNVSHRGHSQNPISTAQPN